MCEEILALFLAALFVICTAFAVPVTASAAARQHVENALETLQTKNGYIPGKSARCGNCFGFVSAVCKELYGVTYYNEQMRGSYRYNHTGNYYTVASKTFFCRHHCCQAEDGGPASDGFYFGQCGRR